MRVRRGDKSDRNGTIFMSHVILMLFWETNTSLSSILECLVLIKWPLTRTLLLHRKDEKPTEDTVLSG